MNLSVVQIEKPADVNVILGHSHFIKTVEDLYETIVQTNPGMKFGVAFCEASGPTLLRFVGNDEAMITLAQKNGMAIAAGHTFLIFLDKGFPVNILNAVKMVPEVCRVFCASANPVEVLIAETDQGRGIVGVIDGFATKGVETDQDIAVRRDFLRRIGYKL
jgi:adenosine/AMP kinase